MLHQFMLGFPLCQPESSFVCILGLYDCTIHKGKDMPISLQGSVPSSNGKAGTTAHPPLPSHQNNLECIRKPTIVHHRKFPILALQHLPLQTTTQRALGKTKANNIRELCCWQTPKHVVCTAPPANLVQFLSTCLSCLEFHTSSIQTLVSLWVRKQGTSKSKPSLWESPAPVCGSSNPLPLHLLALWATSLFLSHRLETRQPRKKKELGSRFRGSKQLLWGCGVYWQWF